MMVFIAVRGDHSLIRALLDSFQTIPPLGFVPTEGLLALMLDLLDLSFTITIRVGGPMVLALTLSFMTLGFLSRTIPQIHLMSVGFPLKAAVGLSIAAITFGSMEGVLVDGLRDAFDVIRIGLGMTPVT
jgi:flagellar biosynthetic protein FliR